MPEFTALQLAVLASAFVAGIAAGWLLRSDRCAREKIAVNAGWQEQLESRQAESERLEERNRALEQQLADSSAAGQEQAARTEELAASLEQALARRDELSGKLAEAASLLDSLTRDNERLKAELDGAETGTSVDVAALKERDDKIRRLKRQLGNWQVRLPGLIERYREREREVQELQSELDRAVNRIACLEAASRPDETHLEALDEEAREQLAASNEPHNEG